MTEEDEAFEDLAKRQGDWGMQGSRKHQIMRYAENVESKGTSMTDKEAMKLALDALETLMIERGSIYEKAIDALKERLAQQEQEPVAWLSIDSIGERYLCFDKPLDNDLVKPLYTTPPQRTWVGLTDEEKGFCAAPTYVETVARIEAKLKEKNT